MILLEHLEEVVLSKKPLIDGWRISISRVSGSCLNMLASASITRWLPLSLFLMKFRILLDSSDGRALSMMYLFINVCSRAWCSCDCRRVVKVVVSEPKQEEKMAMPKKTTKRA